MTPIDLTNGTTVFAQDPRTELLERLRRAVVDGNSFVRYTALDGAEAAVNPRAVNAFGVES